MSLGYITVVPQVVQVPTEVPVPQPDASSGIIGNGMYAAHDEPVSFFLCVPSITFDPQLSVSWIVTVPIRKLGV